jgi:uncharacterized repeat protein (TIGR03803 family)
LSRDGSLYGTTENGGTNGNSGTVFKISTNGAFISLFSFAGGEDGANPYTPLTQGSDGNLYGTTSEGGTNTGSGTIFEITPARVLTSLYSFGCGMDGDSPSGLLAGTNGNFYGTTFDGGTYGAGTIFMVTSGGALTALYSFTGGSDGGSPYTSLTWGSDGSLYGTTATGAVGGYGGVFRLGSSSPPQAPIVQSIARYGGTFEFSWNATPGLIYQVQYKTNLNQASWTDFGPRINAAGASLNVTDSVTNSQRFYRIKLLQ